MSYFVAYVSEKGQVEDGPQFATTLGWHDWGTFVVAHADEFPEAAHLAAHGWLEDDPPGSLAGFEHELERLLHEIGEPNLAAVTAQALAALRAKPAGATGILVTDGEPAGDEDEEGEEGKG